MHLALDHLTLSDAYPWEVVEIASQNGLGGCCLFLTSMSVIPHMPLYDLILDPAARQRTKAALKDCGVRLELAYPFTITGRSQPGEFTQAMNAAADLGARAINLLVYDRDEKRRRETVFEVVRLASERGMTSVIEFYPSSAVKSLAEAVSLVQAVNREELGINLDLLHLYRSGGRLEEIGPAKDHIRFAQLADAPLIAPENLDYEAGRNRTLIGGSDLPIEGFLNALPQDVTLSLEVPRDEDIEAGIGMIERAQRAIHPFKSAVSSVR